MYMYLRVLAETVFKTLNFAFGEYQKLKVSILISFLFLFFNKTLNCTQFLSCLSFMMVTDHNCGKFRFKTLYYIVKVSKLEI